MIQLICREINENKTTKKKSLGYKSVKKKNDDKLNPHSSLQLADFAN